MELVKSQTSSEDATLPDELADTTQSADKGPQQIQHISSSSNQAHIEEEEENTDEVADEASSSDVDLTFLLGGTAKKSKASPKFKIGQLLDQSSDEEEVFAADEPLVAKE